MAPRAWFALQPLLALATVTPVLAQGMVFETKQQDPSRYRPPGLQIVSRRQVPYGEEVIGVYAVRDADDIAEGKRYKVWHETGQDLKVRNETVRCDSESPMRITSTGTQLLMQELNPGGAVGDHNRTAHLIWWAVCLPDFAGQDPNTLQQEARQRGYSGLLMERDHRLPGRPR